ncbi:MAG: sulfatase [Acidobacteriota bacterium]
MSWLVVLLSCIAALGCRPSVEWSIAERGIDEAPPFADLETLVGEIEETPERIAALVGQARLISLGEESRSALLTVAGMPLEVVLRVPEAPAWLRFAVGRPVVADAALSVRVRVGRPDDAARTELLDARLVPGSSGDGPDASPWSLLEIDLEPLADRIGEELVFEFVLGEPPEEPVDLGADDLLFLAHPEIVAARAPAEDRPDILFVVLDTLRADRLSSYGHSVETSPHLDAWAERSATLFEHVIAHAPWTLPSHASMFTGLEAIHHGVNHSVQVPAALDLLAERLRAAGYHTAGVNGGGYLRPRFGLAQGFDVYRTWRDRTREGEIDRHLEWSLRWLDERPDERVFLFFHTYEIHFPYKRREPYFSRLASEVAKGQDDTQIKMRGNPWQHGQLTWNPDYFIAITPEGESTPLTEAQKELTRALYDSGIAYADERVGRLIEAFEARNRPTLIVVTSDHGEALGENEHAGHNYLEDYNLRIPLLISWPDGAAAGRRVERTVRSIDIVPTILDVLDLPAGASSGSGVGPLDGVPLRALALGDSSDTPPLEAWSYAGSANYGLALQVGERLRYVLQNSAWDPVRGRHELRDLAPEGESPAGVDDPRLPRLRQRALEHLDRHHRGLRVTLRHGGESGRFEARLFGPWSHPARIKTLDVGGVTEGVGAVGWAQRVSGQGGVLRLAPGESLRLLVESLVADKLAFELRWEPDEGEPIVRRFRPEVATLAERDVFLYDGERWRRRGDRARLGAGKIGLELSVSELARSTEDAPVNEETRRQLEALGYL